MKLTVPTAKLAALASTCLRVVSTRATLPILGNVLIEASDDSVSLSTTDLDSWETGSAPATVDADGAITVPAKRFAAAVSRLPKEETVLELTKNELRITSGEAEYRLFGLPKSEFPAPPAHKVEVKLNIPHAIIKAAAEACGQCVSEDANRPVLQNVLLEVTEGGAIAFVATDGTRLSKLEGKCDGFSGEPRHILISSRALSEAASFPCGSQESVTLEVSENMISFAGGRTRITAKQSEGSFPKYQQVLPEGEFTVATLDRAEFLEALHRADVLDEKQNGTGTQLEFRNGKLQIGKQMAEIGSFREFIPATFKKGFKVLLSRRFLEGTLKTINTAEVEVRFFGDLAPVIVGPAGGDSSQFTVIMPMRAQ